MWISGTPGDTVAHGISRHTEFNNWRVFHSDGSGDQQEIAVGADGTVFTGTGTSSAPAFEAAGEHGVHGAQSVALLDASEHTDTAAGAAARGYLITGQTASPVWTRLAPTEHAFLTYDGTDLAWDTTPEIQYIADTGGTTRLTFGTSSPHITATGDTKFTGVLRTDSGTPNTAVSGWFGADSWPYGKTAVIAAMGFAISPSATEANGLHGQILLNGSGTLPTMINGLKFNAGLFSASGTHTLAEVNLISAASLWFGSGSYTVTLLRGLLIDHFNSGFDAIAAMTTMYGIQVNATSTDKIGTAYGIWIGDNSGVTAAGYGLYVQDATTYAIFVDAGLSRFDGDGTHIFELPADATANGAAQVGRFAVQLTGGATAYIYYYGS